MSKKVDDLRIAKFHEDREVLAHYNDIDIANRMGVDKSSYSSYIKGRNRITNNFLNRFYNVFGKEIRDILEKRNQTECKEDKNYTKPSDTEGQGRKINELEAKLEKLASSHQLISMEIYRLDQKLGSILENRLDKIEALLSLIVAKNQVLEAPDQKDKETPAVKKRVTKKKPSEEGESPK